MSTAIQSDKDYVGGEWVEPLGGRSSEVVNPATGELIAETPDRARSLLRIADVIDANRDGLGRIESLNVGKPLRKDTSIYAVAEYTNIEHVGISLT